MKKLVFLTALFIFCSVQAQDRNNIDRLKYKSFAFTPLAIYSDGNTGGLLFSADLSYAYKVNIFTLSALTGQEFAISIFGDSTPDSFEQINLFYGRELKLNKTIYVDIHAGLGYFSFKSTSVDPESRGYERKSVLGLPISMKLRFKTGKRFSIGLQFQTNFNVVNDIYTAGVLLQWNKI